MDYIGEGEGTIKEAKKILQDKPRIEVMLSEMLEPHANCCDLSCPLYCVGIYSLQDRVCASRSLQSRPAGDHVIPHAVGHERLCGEHAQGELGRSTPVRARGTDAEHDVVSAIRKSGAVDSILYKRNIIGCDETTSSGVVYLQIKRVNITRELARAVCAARV